MTTKPLLDAVLLGHAKDKLNMDYADCSLTS